MAETGNNSQVQEECLYCHGNVNLAGPCPMCGDASPANPAAAKLYPHPTLTPHYRLRIPFDPAIAGI